MQELENYGSEAGTKKQGKGGGAKSTPGQQGRIVDFRAGQSRKPETFQSSQSSSHRQGSQEGAMFRRRGEAETAWSSFTGKGDLNKPVGLGLKTSWQDGTNSKIERAYKSYRWRNRIHLRRWTSKRGSRNIRQTHTLGFFSPRRDV